MKVKATGVCGKEGVNGNGDILEVTHQPRHQLFHDLEAGGNTQQHIGSESDSSPGYVSRLFQVSQEQDSPVGNNQQHLDVPLLETTTQHTNGDTQHNINNSTTMPVCKVSSNAKVIIAYSILVASSLFWAMSIKINHEASGEDYTSQKASEQINVFTLCSIVLLGVVLGASLGKLATTRVVAESIRGGRAASVALTVSLALFAAIVAFMVINL